MIVAIVCVPCGPRRSFICVRVRILGVLKIFGCCTITPDCSLRLLCSRFLTDSAACVLSFDHSTPLHADDTELQKAALPSDFSQVSRETEVCAADRKDWMNKNKLKLSEEKTELLVEGDRTRLCQVKKEPLTFGPNALPFQTSAKYLGVHLDETLSMKEQVKHCP